VHLAFLELSSDERRPFFEQAALLRGLSPVILEKDFWVSWMLAVLFQSRFGSDLVFKGGTSLSKVFRVIERFSEDIDLSLSPGFVGLTDVASDISRNQANKWMEQAEAACSVVVREQLMRELERTVSDVLGARAEPYLDFEIDATTESPVILFRYPTTQQSGYEYLRRSVKLEFGSLTDQQPADHHPVRPWLADDQPSLFSDWDCQVISLEVERTFWEKATILHAESNRPDDRPTPARFSRHYADVAALAKHPLGAQAVAMHDLRVRVVEWKSKFFASTWARYDLARPGTFGILPQPARVAALQADHRAMRDMYLGDSPEFSAIIAVLEELDHEINRADR